MPLESLFLAFVMFIVLPFTSVVSGLLAWWAFRYPTPRWPIVGLAAAILVAPFVLLAVVSGEEGVGLGIFNPFFLITAAVALGIGITSYRRLRS